MQDTFVKIRTRKKLFNAQAEEFEQSKKALRKKDKSKREDRKGVDWDSFEGDL